MSTEMLPLQYRFMYPDFYFITFLLLGLLLALLYVFIVNGYLRGWRAIPEGNLPEGYQPSTRVSVLIPARNEEKSIEALLQSLAAQTYPSGLREVLIIDDHSTDRTFFLAHSFCQKHSDFRVLNLADYIGGEEVRSYKKKAIEAGVAQSTGELIVTTDADCLVQPEWLMWLVSCHEVHKWHFVAAPVNFHREKSLLERFQSLDFMGMMGVTGAGIRNNWMNMCNGANMAYTRSGFRAVNGFEGIDHLASGDDILLMQKIAAAFPGRAGFLKNRGAVVYTRAKPDLSSFLSQRIRWATKSTHYSEWRITAILSIVFFFCSMIFLSVLCIPLWGWKAVGVCVVLLSVKLISDYFFLAEMTAFFHRRDLMKSFWASQLLHVAYIVAIGILGNVFHQYRWKGRKTS